MKFSSCKLYICCNMYIVPFLFIIFYCYIVKQLGVEVENVQATAMVSLSSSVQASALDCRKQCLLFEACTAAVFYLTNCELM